MFPCSLYPASHGRHPNNLATFCLGCCKGIRKTGWTLVSGNIVVMSFKHRMINVLFRFGWYIFWFSDLLCPSNPFTLQTRFLAILSWSRHPPLKNVSNKGHIPKQDNLLYYTFTSFNLKPWLMVYIYSPQRVRCRSPAPPTRQRRTAPVAAPHASATTPLLWVWYYFINPQSKGITLTLWQK